METVDVKAIQLADPRQKEAIARHAWEALPLSRRRPDNLQVLQDVIHRDPCDFVRLCREEGLPVMVVTVNHHETHTHNHYGYSEPQQGGLTAEQVLAIVQAAQPPQRLPEPSQDVSMLVSAFEARQRRTDELLAAIMVANQQQPQPQPLHVEVNPNIHVSATASGEMGGGVLIILGVIAGILVAIIGGGR